jgi:ABC-type multidrug transport system permease subunit
MLLAYGLQLAQLRTVTGLEIKTYLALWLRGLLVAAPFVGLWLVMRFFFQGIRPLVELVWLGVATGVVLGTFAFSAYRQPSVRRYLWRFAHPAN